MAELRACAEFLQRLVQGQPPIRSSVSSEPARTTLGQGEPAKVAKILNRSESSHLRNRFDGKFPDAHFVVALVCTEDVFWAGCRP
jgi:hypothetical protein